MIPEASKARHALAHAVAQLRSWGDLRTPELYKKPFFADTRVAVVAILVLATVSFTVTDRVPSGLALPLPATAPDPLEAFSGMGTWVDVFDWSHSATGGRPTVTPSDIDDMAERDVETLYLQASRYSAPGAILEPQRLNRLIERAREQNIKVVLWYAPTLVDVPGERRRIDAIGALEPDALVIDVESRNITDPVERNRRLLVLMRGIRKTNPDVPMGIAIQPPVLTEVVNPDFWPAFPYAEIDPLVDVWMPMTYWSERRASSPYRAPYPYVTESVRRLRANVGADRKIAVHPIGGVAASMDEAQWNEYLRALKDSDAVGGSLYDWATTSSALKAEL